MINIVSLFFLSHYSLIKLKNYCYYNKFNNYCVVKHGIFLSQNNHRLLIAGKILDLRIYQDIGALLDQ